MRALVFDKKLYYEAQYPRPERAPGEALVRVLMAGICNTDLEITKGYMGFSGVLGHEFVGVVEEADDPHLIDKRVVGEINAACGNCPTCAKGAPTHCPRRTVLGIQGRDGAFADYLTLPVQNLHIVPESILDTSATFIEPTAAAYEILAQVKILPTDRAVVLGDGKLGLLVAQVLRHTGCHLTAVGMHPAKLSILQSLGIHTACIGESPFPELNSMLSCLAGADVVVDCTGSASGIELGLRLIRPRGTLVLKSTYAGAAPLNLAPIVINEITLIGSRCGSFVPAIQALSEGHIATEPLIEAIYPLQQGLTAIAHASRPGGRKVLIRM